MALSIGHKLGPYEVLAPIGAGGMGEVYKARDTRLDRVVAIKVSAREFGERFQREAQAIASLNHPNICTLHDVGPDETGTARYEVGRWFCHEERSIMIVTARTCQLRRGCATALTTFMPLASMWHL